MKRVSYRKGYADQLFTHYSYDRDNRLVNVQTSLDTVIWDTDIAYEYYAHGPIKRTILGEDNIQGTDYAYTIHGWLKSINHPNTAYDPGNDGAGTTNTTVGKDVFGLTLNYYTNDYTGYSNKYSTDTKAPAHNLYDGNISSMSYRLTKSGAANNDYFMMDVNADDYRYDKLGRLREDIFYNRDNNTTYNTKSYDSYYKYDPNGNIRSLMRNSLYFNTNTNAVDQKQIDNLTYHYGAVPGAITNTLNHVTDAVAGATNGVNDLVTQPLNTYEYDESGNLKRDNELSIDYIWNSSGKIYEIKRTTGANQFTIRFDYDAQGHKIRKQTLNGSGIVQNTTYYVYDAGGTLMSVYTKTGENGAVYQKEAPINAPGRIGMWKFGNAERMHGNTALGSIQLYSRQINKKLYEITDQTGNVRVVLSDNKSVISGAVVPKVIMSSNYYPYGMAQAGRVISEGEDYRYGYNGMEEEDRGQEVSTEIGSTGDKAKPGEANLLNTEYRLYDPRLAQWLTRDPIFHPWESPYASMGGNPILLSDMLGLEAGDSPRFPNLPQTPDFGNPNEYNAGGNENSNGVCSADCLDGGTTGEAVVRPAEQFFWEKETPPEKWLYVSEWGSLGIREYDGSHDVVSTFLYNTLAGVQNDFYGVLDAAANLHVTLWQANRLSGALNEGMNDFLLHGVDLGKVGDGMVSLAKNPHFYEQLVPMLVPFFTKSPRIKVRSSTSVLASEAVAESKGSHIALGVNEYLDDFAERVQAETWKTWGQKNFKHSFLSKINDPDVTIHFNLDGIKKFGNALTDGQKGYMKSEYVTSWELYTVWNNPAARNRTIFYRNGAIELDPYPQNTAH